MRVECVLLININHTHSSFCDLYFIKLALLPDKPFILFPNNVLFVIPPQQIPSYFLKPFPSHFPVNFCLILPNKTFSQTYPTNSSSLYFSSRPLFLVLSELSPFLNASQITFLLLTQQALPSIHHALHPLT